MGREVSKEEFFCDNAKGRFLKSESLGMDGFSSIVRVDYENGWVTYTCSLKNSKTGNHIYNLR
jgi:hypothetical protein